MTSRAEGAGACNDDEFIRQFTRSQTDLRRFIVGMAPTRADADDVLQEVNLALWKKRHLYDPSQDFRRWAFGFALLEIRSFRSRATKGKLWYCDTALDSLAVAWPAEATFDEHCREALANCLKKLGGVEHQVVTAYYAKQATAKELADRTGKPLSTVYKTLTRARESLRLCVKRTMSQAYHPK
jgi:RNA polymerase sigma-70 factor (ECF subfamily)